MSKLQIHQSSLHCAKLMADAFISRNETHVAWLKTVYDIDGHITVENMKNITANPMNINTDYIAADPFYWTVSRNMIMTVYGREALYDRAYIPFTGNGHSAREILFSSLEKRQVYWLRHMTTLFDMGTITYSELADNPVGINYHEENINNEWALNHRTFTIIYATSVLNGRACP